MKKICLLGIFVLSIISHIAQAIPAKPYPIVVTQPDGTRLSIRLRGDESLGYKTTLDGYLVRQNAGGFYVYLLLDEEGDLVESDVIARNAEERSIDDIAFLKSLDNDRIDNVLKNRRKTKESTGPRKAYPLRGNPKALVILVNFSSNTFVVPSPNQAFTNMLNQKGYAAHQATGSARDYFEDASLGLFSPQFDVYGPYTLPRNMNYYGMNVIANGGDDIRPRQMISDACSLAVANGVKLVDYDTDKDGYVDNVFVYYAGVNEAEGGADSTIWPHQWTLTGIKADAPVFGTGADTVRVWSYACTSELKDADPSNQENMCGIGTFVHEFSHVLGLMDYYQTNSASRTNPTPDFWSTMDYGAYLNDGRTPPSPSSYDRFFLNWLTPIQIMDSAHGVLQPLTTSNEAFLLAARKHNMSGQAPDPQEFYLMEYRKTSGWDAYLPNDGMLIWHISYSKTKWINNTVNNTNPLGVYLVCADGTTIYDYEDPSYYYDMKGDPFPGSRDVTSYNPLLWDNMSLNKPITDITMDSMRKYISFKVNGQTCTFLDVDLDTVYVGKSSELSVSVKIMSNVFWTIGKEDDWLELNLDKGANDRLVTLTAASSSIDRNAVIMIYSEDSSLQRKVVLCQSDKIVPTVRLQPVSGLSGSVATISAVIEHPGVVSECGFYISTTSDFKTETTTQVTMDGVAGVIGVEISGLQFSSTYYYKAYAEYIDGVVISGVDNFTTKISNASKKQIDNADKIKVYPNPFENNIVIETGALSVGQVEIFNVYGMRLMHKNVAIAANSSDEIILADLQSGIYFIKMHTSEGWVTKKIIKK